MGISVTDPVGSAIDKTKEILFKPFNIVKWMKLGFCAFLASLGQGGGSGFNGNFNTGRGRTFPGGGTNPFDQALNWVQSNLGIVIVIGIAVFLLFYLIGLLVTWLSCRGKFMFIDGIVKNRGAVREPWGQYKAEGNSLFKFMFVVGLAMLLFVLLLGGVCALIAWGDITSRTFGTAGITAILLFVIPMILVGLAYMVVHFLLIDFVVPTMYLRRVGVMEAWRIVRATFVPYPGTLALYFLFQILIGLGVGMAAFLVTCLTCCIAVIPYVGTVILLPLSVLLYCYRLYFIEQFGPEWKFFPEPDPDPDPVDDGGPGAFGGGDVGEQAPPVGEDFGIVGK